MENKLFIPTGVCSKKISFDYENGIMHNLKFEGGCSGNLKAIGKLVEGMELSRVYEILKGNTCGPRATSCADQLTLAIKEVIDNA